MPLVDFLAQYGSELDDEDRKDMEKHAQTSGSSKPSEAKAAAPTGASVPETPAGEQADTTVARSTRTRARTAPQAAVDPKTLMPPPPPVLGAPEPKICVGGTCHPAGRAGGAGPFCSLTISGCRLDLQF